MVTVNKQLNIKKYFRQCVGSDVNSDNNKHTGLSTSRRFTIIVFLCLGDRDAAKEGRLLPGPYIRMIGMIVVFFRGCNRQLGIF